MSLVLNIYDFLVQSTAKLRSYGDILGIHSWDDLTMMVWLTRAVLGNRATKSCPSSTSKEKPTK